MIILIQSEQNNWRQKGWIDCWDCVEIDLSRPGAWDFDLALMAPSASSSATVFFSWIPTWYDIVYLWLGGGGVGANEVFINRAVVLLLIISISVQNARIKCCCVEPNIHWQMGIHHGYQHQMIAYIDKQDSMLAHGECEPNLLRENM